MWTKKNKENRNEKLSGILSNCGFKRTISILLVLCLVASQGFALPSKAGLYQRMEMNSQENSQMESLSNSTESKKEVVISQEQREEMLTKLSGSYNNLTTIENDTVDSMELTAILQKSMTLLISDNDEKDKVINDQEETIATQKGQIKELKGKKITKIIEIGGTYNLDYGWGAEASAGLKFDNVVTKVGVEAPIADLMNPAKLTDLNTYKFKATVGLQW